MIVAFPALLQCLANMALPIKDNGTCHTTFGNVDICTTPGCVRAANEFLRSMDLKVNPCNDFYTFACGRWKEDNPIPDDKATISRFVEISNQLEIKLRVLYQSEASANDVLPKKWVRTIYKKCMDSKVLNELGSKPLRDAIASLSAWPLIDAKASVADFDMNRLFSKIQENYATDTIVHGGVTIDDKNSTQYIFALTEGGLALSRDYYLNATAYGDFQQAYLKHIKSIASLLAKDGNLELPADFDQQVQEMFDFEAKLAQITPTPEEMRNVTARYNKLTLQDLKSTLSWVDWDFFFHTVYPAEVQHLITDQMTVLITSPTYYVEFGKLINSTDKRIVLNYIMWSFVRQWDDLDERFEAINDDLTKALTGRDQKPPRWKKCVAAVKDSLSKAAGALFVAKYFREKDKATALELVDFLKLEFQDMLTTNTWMDDNTKKQALYKLSSIYSHIGYPDWLLNDTMLVEYYQGLNISDTSSLFDITLTLSLWSQDFRLKKLLKPYDRKEFDEFPPTVNAFYDPVQNSIMFPAGILQPPFFDAEYPAAVNFGGIGAVIGHEITHGFDDQGRLYNDKGILTDWWTTSSAQQFDKKADCIADQYGDYRSSLANNMFVNGRLTLGENIADNGGIKMAYLAYKMYTKKRGDKDVRLPGLQNFTGDQLFFLSWANAWCDNIKPQLALKYILTDPHSPHEFRVTGPLSNMPQFADAFSCKAGDALELPEEKRCAVW